MEVTITSENFENLKNGELPLVVDVWTTWCGPCRALAPVVSELAAEFDGKLVVGKCNAEENDAARKHQNDHKNDPFPPVFLDISPRSGSGR